MNILFPRATRGLFRVLVVFGSFIICTALTLHLSMKPASSTLPAKAPMPVTVHAEGRGKPFFNFQDGRQLSVTFLDQNSATQALQGEQAVPRALASADLDDNGTPDLIVGYSTQGTGIVTIQRGNPDAFAPADDSVLMRLQQGYNPQSLLPGADVYPIPVPADFLVTGNFNQDSKKDVLVAAKGGGLYLLAGDGRGGGALHRR